MAHLHPCSEPPIARSMQLDCRVMLRGGLIYARRSAGSPFRMLFDDWISAAWLRMARALAGSLDGAKGAT